MLAAAVEPAVAPAPPSLLEPPGPRKSVTFRLDEPDLESLEDSKLAELALTVPGSVLLELTKRSRSIYPGSPQYAARVSALINVISQVPWTDLEEGDFSLFTSALTSLAATCPSCVASIFKFILTEACLKPAPQAEPIILTLVKSVPASVPLLATALEYNFPYHSRPAEHLSLYVKFILSLSKHLPLMRAKILELIVEKFLTVDVAIQIEATNLPEELEDDAGKSFKRSKSVESEPEEEEDLEVIDSDLLRRSSSPVALNMVDLMNKLDGGLSFLFDYFDDLSKNPEEFRTCFDGLLQIFEKSLLPTFRSRSTPFVLFYAISLNPSLSDVFLGFLMKRLYHVFDQPGDGKKKSLASTASLLTVVNASYIGSFVARAKYMPHKLVRLSFDMLLTWCLRFLGDLPNHLRSGVKAFRSSSNVVSERVAVFYAVSQAVMYIFCFRHRLLMQEHDNLDGESIKGNYRNFLLPILQSSLNPLKWCMSAVVEEFMRLAELYDLVDCHNILFKSSRRSAPPRSTRTSGVAQFEDESLVSPTADQTGSFLGDLDSYFPFDPIMLNKCSERFGPEIYNEWNSQDSECTEEEEEDDNKDPESDGEDARLKAASSDLLFSNPAWQSLAIRR